MIGCISLVRSEDAADLTSAPGRHESAEIKSNFSQVRSLSFGHRRPCHSARASAEETSPALRRTRMSFPPGPSLRGDEPLEDAVSPPP